MCGEQGIYVHVCVEKRWAAGIGREGQVFIGKGRVSSTLHQMPGWTSQTLHFTSRTFERHGGDAAAKL